MPSHQIRCGCPAADFTTGITGVTKWNYDIFGKPVAHACFMETLAPPNCIAVSQSIYAACKENPKLNFKCVRKQQEGTQYCIIEGSDTPHVNAFIKTYLSAPRQHRDSLALLTAPEDGLEPRVRECISELLTINPDNSPELSLTDFSFDISQQFGYSREELEVEEKAIKRKPITLRFKKREFEVIYSQRIVTAVHKYTRYLSLIFACMLIIFLLVDIAVDEVMTAEKYIFPLTALLLISYMAFARKYDYHPYAGFVALFVVSVFGFSFILVSYLNPTVIHYSWGVLAILYMASFIRVPAVMLLLAQLSLVIVSSILVFIVTRRVSASAPIDALRFACSNLLIFGFSISTQLFLQKSFRMQFLANKKIKYDLFHQKVGQHRAKLLLHNILPEDIIPRLQERNPHGVVEFFEEATLMFINIVNLEELTANLDASHVFQVYNDLFTLFDEATRSFGLEKIKTINTVYMVAGGLPKKINNHVDRTLQLAIEIFRCASQYKVKGISQRIRVRIGIATGPVIAGIIGKKKYAYDCWSDTVNTASRMESNGWPGYVQVTPKAFNLLHSRSQFEKRENVFIKGKGNMDTYVLQLSKFVNLY